MGKIKDNKSIFSIAQLIIAADILVHQYSGLSLEQKKKLILSLEKAKKLNKVKSIEED